MEYNSQHALTARKWSWKLEFLAGVLEYTCYKNWLRRNVNNLPWDKKLQKVILKDPCAKTAACNFDTVWTLFLLSLTGNIIKT